MIKPKLTKNCNICGNSFKPFKTTDKYCSWKCANSDQKEDKKEVKFYQIKKQSDKLKKDYSVYLKLRKEFLSNPDNKYCFIDGCNRLATTIEHTKGRIGKNLLDVSGWRPCCWNHNSELENNTELSEKYQYSKFHKGKKIKK